MSQDETDRQRFVNFLSHYDLSKYYDAFCEIGVTKLPHLKDVRDEDLKQMGLSNPERTRLMKKFDANFSKMGKLKVSLVCIPAFSKYQYFKPRNLNPVCMSVYHFFVSIEKNTR